jgi:hypothetical protein
MVIVHAQGSLKPSKHAKALLTLAMFRKGSQFVAAAILLKQRGGHQYVVLHLVCQGMEILQKALLLARDYNTYTRQIKDRRLFGHDLIKGADAIADTYGFRKASGALRSELERLNRYYTQHVLRYASPADILVDPNSIPYGRVLKRCVALIRYGSKKLKITNKNANLDGIY